LFLRGELGSKRGKEASAGAIKSCGEGRIMGCGAWKKNKEGGTGSEGGRFMKSVAWGGPNGG